MIAFDAVGGGLQAGGGVTSVTFSHTCASNSILLLFAYVDTDSDIVSGATYNGVSMTLVASASSGATKQRIYLFRLLNPASGTHDVYISCSAANQLGGKSFSYTGADRSSQPDSYNSGTTGAGSTSATVSTTVVADNCWLVGCSRDDSGGSSANNFTARGDAVNTMVGGDSNAVVEAGSRSFVWNKDNGATLTAMICSIKPAVAGGFANIKKILGVPVANIKKILGVPVANIKKFNGVASVVVFISFFLY